MASTVILVHGFWLGSWAWDDVAARLRAAGRTVLAPTLPGNEAVTTDRSGIGLADHIAAVVALVDQTAGPITLVGHSAGGAVVHAVVDRRPERISRAVYVDTRPLPDGIALNPALAGDGVEVPLRPWAQFAPGWLDGLDADALDRFERMATPSAAAVARDIQVLRDPRRYDVPVTEIPCTVTAQAMLDLATAGDPYFTELPLLADLTFVEIPTGHFPMLSEPALLADAILEASR